MKTGRPSGLFLNCAEANDSIFESGKMAYDCLKDSRSYTLDYLEIDRDNRTVSTDYDFYFFNYHNLTMSWLDTRLIRDLLPGVKMTMVLEVSPNDPFVFCPPTDFDIYCVLDPTLTPDRSNVYTFPRPLETFVDRGIYEPHDTPVIGSFGFATPGKGFEHLIDAVNREFERAVVRINIPFGTYTDDGGKYAMYLAKACRDKAKAGIEVLVTHDFMSKSELIGWCAENTINCFLYDRFMQGLAATTDQAISSGRPLIISKNNTFRHIQKYIKPFPYQGLKEAIDNTKTGVVQMQQAWSADKFRERFESVLAKCDLEQTGPKKEGTVDLPIYGPGIIQKLRNKLTLRYRFRALLDKITQSGKPAEVAVIPRGGEDVIVADLFDQLKIKNIGYLDISSIGSDEFAKTGWLYEMGHRGVLVSTDVDICNQAKIARPRDTVLNIQIDLPGDEIGPAPDNVQGGININELIATHFTECPDFVSLGTGGTELRILQSIDPDRFCAAIVSVATPVSAIEAPRSESELETQMAALGYFLFRSTGVSSIFVNRGLYDFYIYQSQESIAGH